MLSPAVLGGVISLFVIATVASNDHRNRTNNKKVRRIELEYRRRKMNKNRK
jgi:hypothetical protein